LQTRRATRRLRHGFLGFGQRSVQRDHQRAVALHHGHGFGGEAGPLLLKNSRRPADLFRHRRAWLVHVW